MIDHSGSMEKAGLGEKEVRMLVAGELVTAKSGETLPAEDPTTEGELARIPVARAEDVDRAVEAARKAFDEGKWWREWPAHKRAKCMVKLAGLVRDKEKELAKIESLDVGMPYNFARRFSTKSLIRNLEYFASWPDKVVGDVIPGASPSTFSFARPEPYGVVAAIFPWNVPLMFVGAKLGPALAAGNCVILKPSEQASLSALRVGELIKEAGFPDGVVQVLSGDGETGRLLVEHKGIDLISFTGGKEIARRIQESAAKTLKPTLFELGGKSPNIVFADAELSKTTMMSTFGIFGLSGQACAAGSRLLVERSIQEQLVAQIAMFGGGLAVGDPMNPATMVGPLVSGRQKDRVQDFISGGREAGAEVTLEGKLPEELRGRGHFVAPHIFSGVTPAMALWKEEVFGPVLSVTAFDTEEEALVLANDTEYGLAAGVWTSDLGRAHRMVRGIEAGVIWVNTYGVLPVNLPFGGFKQSGWGREGGREALRSYTRVKSVVMEG